MRSLLAPFLLLAALALAASPAAAQTATARVRASATVVPRLRVDAPAALSGDRDAGGGASLTGRVSGAGRARPLVTVRGAPAGARCLSAAADAAAGTPGADGWSARVSCRVEGAPAAPPAGGEPGPVTVVVAVVG